LRYVILKILLILIIIACIFLCLPQVAESEPVMETPEPTTTPEPIPTQTPEQPEPITYAPNPLPTPEPTSEPTPEPYSESEKEIIAKVVSAEARGECFEGQVMVAVVVLKRYESGKFGKSIKKVAYARSQFANGTQYNAENMEAVEEAIEHLSEYPDNLFYFKRADRKYWGKGHSIVRYCRIENHTFYVEE
jgi:N-acetylmuramoyl-L-alanine amidase